MMRYKLLHETAFSNDILMYDYDSEDGFFFYRERFDDFMIGYFENLEIEGRKLIDIVDDIEEIDAM